MLDDIKELMHSFNAANCNISGLYRRWAQKHNMNYYMTGILYTLVMEGSTTQKELCDYYEIPKQTVNNTISAMRRKQYIALTQDEQDKRARRITLTETGKAYADEQLAELIGIEKRALQKFSIAKMRKIVELMNEYNDILGSEMSDRTESADAQQKGIESHE